MGDRPLKVIQISDLHVDPSDPVGRDRYERVRRAVDQRRPDLIINTGDVSDDGLAKPDMFPELQRWLEAFDAPVLSVPGNHDIGNKVGEEPPNVTQDYLDAYLTVFGDDRFSCERAGWRLIGINSMLLGTDLEREAGQFEWARAQLDEAEADGQSVALWMHMPLFLQSPDEQVVGGSLYWVPDPRVRDAWLELVDRPCVRLIANGHVHWYATMQANDTQWVWAPSLQGLVVDDYLFPRGGNAVGFISYSLGHPSVTHELITIETEAKLIQLNYPEA